MKMTYVFWFEYDNEYVETFHNFKRGTSYDYVEECYDEWMMSNGYYEDDIETMFENGTTGFYKED